LTSDDPIRPSYESDQIFRVFVVLAGDAGQSSAFVDHAAEYGLMFGSGSSVTATTLEERYHVHSQDCGVAVCAFGILKNLVDAFDGTC
jgi:hypothetical protein